MGSNKLPYFPFYADDYLEDPAVIQMDADAEGCYIHLLARSWKSPTPGIIWAGHVMELSSGHRLSRQYGLLWDEKRSDVELGESESIDNLGFDRWEEVEKQLVVAFDTTSSPGYWVQKRMVREYERLTKNLKARQAGAQKTNDYRDGNRDGNRTITDTVSGRRPTEEVEVDSEVEREESKPKDSSLAGARCKRRSPEGEARTTDPADKDWVEAFVKFFWPDYLGLRKCSKAAAFKAWMAVPHRKGQEDFDALDAAFQSDIRSWKAEGRDAKYIPHAASWLNDYRRNLTLKLVEAQ